MSSVSLHFLLLRITIIIYLLLPVSHLDIYGSYILIFQVVFLLSRGISCGVWYIMWFWFR